jgi:hypothetical protein
MPARTPSTVKVQVQSCKRLQTISGFRPPGNDSAPRSSGCSAAQLTAEGPLALECQLACLRLTGGVGGPRQGGLCRCASPVIVCHTCTACCRSTLRHCGHKTVVRCASLGNCLKGWLPAVKPFMYLAYMTCGSLTKRGAAAVEPVLPSSGRQGMTLTSVFYSAPRPAFSIRLEGLSANI